MAGLLEPFAGERSERFAKRLIETFGTLGAALRAPPDQLDFAAGDDMDVCTLLRAACELIEGSLREQLAGTPVMVADPNLIQYLRLQLQGRTEERLHVVFLNRAQFYIRDECMALGGPSSIEIRMRPLFKRALELNASGLLLAHNHPSGSVTPSAGDIKSTEELISVAKALDLLILDHLIIAGRSAYSMRKGGVL